MRNLALEIDNGSGYQWAWLDEDASVTVENVNPIFDTEAGGTFTHAISLDVARNSHIFGAAADFRGPRIFNLLRKRKARLWIMGIPVTGIIQLDSQLSVEDGKVDIEIVSNSKELKDLLDGVNCRDVEISDDKIVLGFALPEYMDIKIKAKVYENIPLNLIGYGIISSTQLSSPKWWDRIEPYKTTKYISHQIALPKVLFCKSKGSGISSGAIDFSNVQHPYSPGSTYNKNNKQTYPYCNVRACYKKYVHTSDGGSSSWKEKRGYMYRNPEDINSAPCFYIAYWFRKLWENMGIIVESNTLEKIKDFNRIAFFHFDPHFDYGDTLNDYLSLSEEQQENNAFKIKVDKSIENENHNFHIGGDMKGIGYFVEDMNYQAKLRWAIANSDNFPNTDASNMIDAMQSAFGARFLYNSSMSSLKVVLIRDILRQSVTNELHCVVTNYDKTELGTVGFKLKYEGSSDATYNGITKVDDVTGAHEQYDADTNFNYTDWSNVIFISENTISQGVTNASRQIDIPTYIALVNHITNSDKTCYVSCTTGNSYRIKVSSDADDESTLYPSLFQVGMFQDWTEGDCSHAAKDDNIIEEISIPFTPIIPNDINIDEEKKIYYGSSSNSYKQVFAQLIDGEIHNNDYSNQGTIHDGVYEYKNVSFVSGDVYTVDISEAGNQTLEVQNKSILTGTITLTLYARETYDISNDGPYYTYTHDSISLGVMRGSGNDASLIYDNYNYDLEDGETWAQTSGSDAEFTADNLDEYGNSFDYNGTTEGLGYDYNSDYNFPLSLKLRAEKENPGYSSYVKENADTLYSIYKIDSNHFKYNGYKYTKDGASVYLKNGTKVPNTRFFPINGTNAAGRGLGDRFYKEYAYWVLNRKILEMDVEASAAVLTGIDMTKRYRIGGVEGFIKQYSYSVDMKSGVSGAKIELYYI